MIFKTKMRMEDLHTFSTPELVRFLGTRFPIFVSQPN